MNQDRLKAEAQLKALTAEYRTFLDSHIGQVHVKWLQDEEASLIDKALTEKDRDARLSFLDQAKVIRTELQYLDGFRD